MGKLLRLVTRALNLETAGDLYGAWKEYRQAAETFDGLGDVAGFRERAAALEKEKAVREGAKLERREFDEQMRLSADISSGLEELGRNSTNGVDARNEIERRIAELRGRVKDEKNLRELRVAQRALAGIFIEAIEAGNTQSDAKNYSLARNYFELAVDASPDSAWALSLLAVARAEDGDRKGTFEALRRAREKSKDVPAFCAWLKDEPALAKFRDAPEFRALVEVGKIRIRLGGSGAIRIVGRVVCRVENAENPDRRTLRLIEHMFGTRYSSGRSERRPHGCDARRAWLRSGFDGAAHKNAGWQPALRNLGARWAGSIVEHADTGRSACATRLLPRLCSDR